MHQPKRRAEAAAVDGARPGKLPGAVGLAALVHCDGFWCRYFKEPIVLKYSLFYSYLIDAVHS
jgi:hypothetical protein